MKFYVYAVNNKDTNQTLRIGETINLKKRLWRYTQKPQINQNGTSLCGGQFYSQNIELIVLRECETREESRKWEGIFKQLLGFEWTERTRGIKVGKNYGSIQGQKNKETMSKPVLVFRKNTGEFIGEFESKMEAARQLGVRDGNITHVLNGKQTHTGGYTFQYATE